MRKERIPTAERMILCFMSVMLSAWVVVLRELEWRDRGVEASGVEWEVAGSRGAEGVLGIPWRDCKLRSFSRYVSHLVKADY